MIISEEFQNKVERLKSYYENLKLDSKDIIDESLKILFIIPSLKQSDKYVNEITKRHIDFMNQNNIRYDICILENKLSDENLLHQNISNSNHKYIVFHPNILAYLKNVVKSSFSNRCIIILPEETLFIRKKSVKNAFNEADVILNNMKGVLYIDDEYKDPTNDTYRLALGFRELKINKVLNDLKIDNQKIIEKKPWEI